MLNERSQIKKNIPYDLTNIELQKMQINMQKRSVSKAETRRIALQIA